MAIEKYLSLGSCLLACTNAKCLVVQLLLYFSCNKYLQNLMLTVDASRALRSLNNDRNYGVQYVLKTRLNHQNGLQYPKICC